MEELEGIFVDLFLFVDELIKDYGEPVEPDENIPDCGCNTIPTFSIKSVLAGEDVTIHTYNFPKNVEFTVLMGKMWTRGIKGIEVAKLNSGDGGSAAVVVALLWMIAVLSPWAAQRQSELQKQVVTQAPANADADKPTPQE
ncbi:MAG TPA: hypothetical protein PKX60_04895, partial [Prolixibacteraceae bacterium]|nr:hypothetical protein [Prolixibacteraceae bacterium]